MPPTDQHEQLAPADRIDELPDFDTWPVTTEGIPQQELLEADYMESENERVDVLSPPHGLSDRLRGIWVGVHARLIECNWNLERRWHDMSRGQRMVARLTTGTTVALVGISALVVGRSSGAAATGLEDAGLIHFPEMPVGSAPRYQQQNNPENLGTQLTLAAHTAAQEALQNDYDGQIDLELDPNARPDPVPLGKWNKETGHGTIWNQVIEYADEMGYGELSPRQERALVQETLDHEKLTWGKARNLPSTYEPELLTRNEMQTILNDTGAVRTHAPDLPAVPPIDDRDIDLPPRDPVTDTKAKPGVRSGIDPYEEVPKFPWVDWLPDDNLNPKDPDWVIDNWLIRTRVDDELGELLIAAGAAGVVAYGARQRQKRRSAEARLAGYERGRPIVADDEVPVVTTPSTRTTARRPAVVRGRRRLQRRHIPVTRDNFTDRRIRGAL